MLGSGSMVRHPFIWGNKRDGAPITLEPGPDRISPPKRVYGLSQTGLRKIHSSRGKCRPLEAILAALEENTRAG